MALTYMRIYSEQLPELEALPAEIYKDMHLALMRYAFEDVEPDYEPGTMEYYVWTTLKRFVERDKGIHDAKVAAGSKPKQTGAEPSRDEQTEADGSTEEQTGAEASKQEQNGFCSDLPPLNIKNKNKNKSTRGIREEEEEEEDILTGTRAREEVVEAWENEYGSRPYPGIISDIADTAERCGFGPGIITEAVRAACRRNADSPVDYVRELLGDWQKQKISTLDELSQYQFLRDAAAGRIDSADRFKALGDLKAFAQRAGP